jgi:hypothetical protein
MSTCQSWKFGESLHDPLHYPGECPTCWVECTNEAEEGHPRCRSCYETLAGSKVGWVRRLLINEENPPDYVVVALVDDGNFSVAGTARWHMTNRPGIGPKEHIVEGPRDEDQGHSDVMVDEPIEDVEEIEDEDALGW